MSEIELDVWNKFFFNKLMFSLSFWSTGDFLLLFSSRQDTQRYHLTDVSPQSNSPAGHVVPHSIISESNDVKFAFSHTHCAHFLHTHTRLHTTHHSHPYWVISQSVQCQAQQGYLPDYPKSVPLAAVSVRQLRGTLRISLIHSRTSILWWRRIWLPWESQSYSSSAPSSWTSALWHSEHSRRTHIQCVCGVWRVVEWCVWLCGRGRDEGERERGKINFWKNEIGI